MSTRRISRLAAVLAVAVTTGVAGPASAAPGVPVDDTAQLQQLLDQLRSQSAAPGTGLTFGDGTDDVTLASGTRYNLADEPIESTDKVRVASNTKMYVSVVVLQLVAEGKLALDVPVERYVPGVLRYPADKVPGDPAAYDGRAVTIRQLLQHTSGVPEYLDLTYLLNPWWQIVAPTTPGIVNGVLPKGPTFLPGSKWTYSNTNYVLAGMLVQAVTGRPIGTEIKDRIVTPLGLTNTFFAGRYQKDLPGSHVRGYLSAAAPVDVTHYEPGVWNAAGALVSSPDDMNTFISALLGGRLLAPAQLAEMMADDLPGTPSSGYGLGFMSVPLSCGEAWGHSGRVAGYDTLTLGLPDGRHAFLTINALSDLGQLIPPADPVTLNEIMDLALC